LERQEHGVASFAWPTCFKYEQLKNELALSRAIKKLIFRRAPTIHESILGGIDLQ
jgi:hypothetical protein